MSAATPPKDNSLVDEIAQAIRVDIWQGRYALGSKLRQELLATQYGVSRTPIREALRKLQAEGIIVFVPRSGAIVRTPLTREIREAYQVRAELEGLAAELATHWIQDDQLRELTDAEQAFVRLAGAIASRADSEPPEESVVNEWTAANDLFHQTIYRASRNAMLVQTITDLHRKVPRGLAGRAFASNSRLMHQNAEQHSEIRAAIELRAAESARALMREHVRESGEAAVSWFEAAQEPLAY